MNFKISLVMPVYNCEKTIFKALSSVYSQNVKISEVIIINDGSEDETKKEIIKWNKKLPIIYIENKKNMGVTFSLNKGVEKSVGELIFRLDADDHWEEDHVHNIIKLYLKEDNSVLFAARTRIINTFNNKVYFSKKLSNSNIRSLLMWDNPIIHSSIAFKKSYFNKVSGYGNRKHCQDYILYIKLLKFGDLSFSKKISVNFLIHNNSISRSNKKARLRERLRNQWIAIGYFGNKYFLSVLKIFPILIIRSFLNK